MNKVFVWFIAISLSLVVSIFILALTFSYSENIRGVEQNVVYTVQTLMLGHDLYTNPEDVPFEITQYTPLYYIITAQAARIFSFTPGEDVVEIYRLGRAISLICWLLLCLITYWFVGQFIQNRLTKSIIALAVFIIPIPWYMLFRIDGMAALFALASVYLYVYQFTMSANNSAPSRRLQLVFISGFLAYLAFLTKQSFVIYWFAMASFSLARLQYREFIFLALGATSSLIVTSLLFGDFYSLIPSSTNYFYAHVIDGVDNGIDLKLAIEKGYLIYIRDFGTIATASLLVVIYLIIHKIHKQQISTPVYENTLFSLSWVYVIITAFNLVTMMKLGATINYMNESIILAIILIALFIYSKEDLLNILKTPMIKFALFYVVLGYFVSIFASYAWTYRGNIIDREFEALSSSEFNFLQTELDNNPDSLIFTHSRSINNIFPDNVIIPQIEITTISITRNILTLEKIPELFEDGRLCYLVFNYEPQSIYGYPVPNLDMIHSGERQNVYFVQTCSR